MSSFFKQLFPFMKVKKKKEFSYIMKGIDPSTIWELVGELGDGSFGKVYKAQHKTENLLAAAKIIIVNDDNELDDFMVEIDILSECKHKHIVGLHETYYHSGKLWMMLEFCSGGALDDLMLEIERGLTENEIKTVCRQLFEALLYLHSCKIIHRDLKAGNLLLSGDGNIKLADFGVSAKNKKTLQRRTTFIGTPYWMAPEVVVTETCKDDPYEYKADIWSAGITLIELAQMVPPYHAMHPMRVLFKIPKADPPTLSNTNRWSKDFQDFLASCVVKSPEMRSTAMELMKHPFIADYTDNKALKDLYNEVKAEVIEEIEDLPEDKEFVKDNEIGFKASGSVDSLEVVNELEKEKESQNEKEMEGKKETIVDETPAELEEKEKEKGEKAEEKVEKEEKEKEEGREEEEKEEDEKEEESEDQVEEPEVTKPEEPKAKDEKSEEKAAEEKIEDLPEEDKTTEIEEEETEQKEEETEQKEEEKLDEDKNKNEGEEVSKKEPVDEDKESIDKYSTRLDNILDDMEDTGDKPKQEEEGPQDEKEKESEPAKAEETPEKPAEDPATENVEEEEVKEVTDEEKKGNESNEESKEEQPQIKEFLIYIDDDPGIVDKLKEIKKEEEKQALKDALSAAAAGTSALPNGLPSSTEHKGIQDNRDGGEKKQVEKHFKTLKRTRKFATQDGQIVTETTSRVVDVSGEDFKNALLKEQQQRKVNLRELKVLQRQEQKQGIELMAKIRRQWETQEQRFEQEIQDVERKYDVELDTLSRNQKRDIEKLEVTQNADLRASSRKMRQDQEKELRRFKENLKEEAKRSKKENDKLPRIYRKETWKRKKEELDVSHQQAEHEFQSMQQAEFEKFYKQMIDLHRQKMFELEMQFLESKHERKRGHESEKWEIEYRHLNERHQLAKSQLKETFFLQRSQMLNRHHKETEQHQHLTKLQEEEMKRRHEIERKRLPKIQRNEMKSKTQNYRKSLRLDKGMSLEDEKELTREFEQAERKRSKSECEKMLIRQELEVEELKVTSESAIKELLQLQNEKRHMLMESETCKLKERDDKHSSQMAAWKAELGPRKKRLEEEFAWEKREQQLFYARGNEHQPDNPPNDLRVPSETSSKDSADGSGGSQTGSQKTPDDSSSRSSGSMEI